MKQPKIKVGDKTYPQQWFSWKEVQEIVKREMKAMAKPKDVGFDWDGKTVKW